MLGEEGHGWSVALTTLMNERVALGGRSRRAGAGPIHIVADLYKRQLAKHPDDALRKQDRLVQLWIRAEVLRLTNARAAANRALNPGPEGSIGKLMLAELNKAIGELSIDLLGADGMLMPSGFPMTRAEQTSFSPSDIPKMFLRMRVQSIEGGTSEVMRNILAERVLGLPK